MSFRLTRATLDRPKQTIHACELLHAHAPAVAQACAELTDTEAAVAVIHREDMVFAGVWIIPVSHVGRQVPELESGGWAFIFSRGTPIEEIEQRAMIAARLAFARWETMERWAARNR